MSPSVCFQVAAMAFDQRAEGVSQQKYCASWRETKWAVAGSRHQYGQGLVHFCQPAPLMVVAKEDLVAKVVAVGIELEQPVIADIGAIVRPRQRAKGRGWP